MTKWNSAMFLYIWTPYLPRAAYYTKDNTWEPFPLGLQTVCVWLPAGSGLCSHCVTANLDQLLRKVPGYDGQNTTAACPTRGLPQVAPAVKACLPVQQT